MNISKNQILFNERHRLLLASPEKWKMVSSLFPPDHSPVNDRAHRQWLRTNSDSHPRKEILFVLEGRVLNSLNRRIFPATSGTIFLFDAYEEHDRSYPRETGKAVHLWLYFGQNQIIAPLLSVNKGRIEYRRKRLFLENAELCNAIVKGWNGIKSSPLDEELKRVKLKTLISLLFLELVELDMADEDSGCEGEKQQMKIIRMVRQHISDTSGKGLTVDKLARIAGYSKFHFLRFFKKHTGQKLHDCINASRMRKTEEMLKNGFLQKQISAELGFSCPSAFSNWYAGHKDS